MAMVLLAALLALAPGVRAQQQTPPDTQAAPPQSTTSASSTQRTNATRQPDSIDALEDEVLIEAVEDHITSMDSHIDLKYNHDEFDDGTNVDRVPVHWQQALGSSKRFAAGIEVPFWHYDGENVEPSANGIGDITLEFHGMLTKGEKFEQAAGLELTRPSSSSA
jgi:hypothetical protein